MKRQLYYTVHIEKEPIDQDLFYDTGWKTVYVYEIKSGELVELEALQLHLRENSEEEIIETLNLDSVKVNLKLL